MNVTYFQSFHCYPYIGIPPQKPISGCTQCIICLINLVVHVNKEINNPRAEGARVNFRPLLYDFGEKLAPLVPIGAQAKFFNDCLFFEYFRYLFSFPGGEFFHNPPKVAASAARSEIP